MDIKIPKKVVCLFSRNFTEDPTRLTQKDFICNIDRYGWGDCGDGILDIAIQQLPMEDTTNNCCPVQYIREPCLHAEKILSYQKIPTEDLYKAWTT